MPIAQKFTKQHEPHVAGKNRFDELELVKNIVRRCPQPEPTFKKEEFSKDDED